MAERVALNNGTSGEQSGVYRDQAAVEGNVGTESTDDELAKELERLTKGNNQA